MKSHDEKITDHYIDEKKTKDRLYNILLEVIDKKELNAADLSFALDISKYHAERIISFDIEHDSLFDLMKYLTRLGYDIYMAVLPQFNDEPGRIRIGMMGNEEEESSSTATFREVIEE